ncbi:ubiquitin-associated domain-containing protein 1-like [Saccoglossus kowalevskii]|uniref:Ubiquitin-associated domain-containing protein 1-like n=1 Tax=Saccoglossus kowalevskii TaxID=10224 RepID=A0ABM0GMA1_SACKO|nr:PREDICTED: ubiquitin-associated domain-containing protein 1-like [Saccoglossus kowalevskii]
MVVTESNLFEGKMKLRITDMKGEEAIVEVDPSTLVEKVKEKFLWNCAAMTSPEASKSVLYFKLVHVTSGNVLSDSSTLTQEGIKDGDYLLLLKRRVPSTTSLSEQDLNKAPDAEDIAKATEGVPVKNTDRKPENLPPVAEFSKELRKILITLLDTTHRLLSLNTEAVDLVLQASEILTHKKASQVDPSALKQLQEMGFAENRATKALILNKMNPVDAMEWLLKHDGDADIDQPIVEMPESVVDDSEGATNHTEVEENLLLFKRFRQRKFKPNQRALLRLKEMGFEEKDILDALKVCGNSEKSACDWLLGDKTPTVEDMQQGIDPKSSLFQAIVNDPVVLLGLNNPRTLLGFEHMLENPHTSSEYLSDSVIGPVLIQISRIYQTERQFSLS